MTKDQEIETLRREVKDLQELLSVPCPPGKIRIDIRVCNHEGKVSSLGSLSYLNQMDNKLKRQAKFLGILNSLEELEVFGEQPRIIT